jgi:hypothetical protein
MGRVDEARMNTLLLALEAWLVLSLPVGIAAGVLLQWRLR